MTVELTTFGMITEEEEGLVVLEGEAYDGEVDDELELEGEMEQI